VLNVNVWIASIILAIRLDIITVKVAMVAKALCLYV
jgi:hypothetical protein